ncbi:MAG: acyl-CoA thioester hydrolase/BAAT C-terminal domain-containing protein, partial [Melioribacteraceae bacterium]
LYLPIGNNPQKHPLVIWVSGSGPSYRTVKTDQSRALINCFLESGIAYFRIDKPGCGDSKGEVSDDSLFDQLSGIVADAIKVLMKHPGIDSEKIGLFGSSQAGYIMPLVATKAKNLAFIMGSSCPGENSIEQWNYLIEKQMLCEGIGKERAWINVEMFSTLRTTTDHEKFIRALDYFEKNPMIIKSVNYDSSFAGKARNWWPRKIDVGDEAHFNPVKIIEKTTIPVFVVFGENDTQIDPRQGYKSYSKALKKAGNPFYRIEMLPGVDHNMSITKTGCLGEIEKLNKTGLYQYSPRYFEIIRNWVNLILKQWKN